MSDPWEFFRALANGRNYETPKTEETEVGSDAKSNNLLVDSPTESLKLKGCKTAPLEKGVKGQSTEPQNKGLELREVFPRILAGLS